MQCLVRSQAEPALLKLGFVRGCSTLYAQAGGFSLRMGSRIFASVLTAVLSTICWSLVGNAQVQTSPAKKPPTTATGPAAPQSTHFPVLLLAVGMNPAWNLRVGPNGPERLDRPAYPPIPLEPAEVSQEAPNAYLYRAKDTGTGAPVTLLLTREACSDGTTTKYSFKSVVQHAQLGTLAGCARIAAELYPRPSNQNDDTDDDAAKKKATTDTTTTVTSFKMPVDVAYVTTTNKVVLRHGAVPHVVAAEGSQPSLSHDGRRLLYTREEKDGTRSIVLYEALTGKSTDLLTGNVQQPSWSPDDTRVAFEKFVDGNWHLWIAPVVAPASAAQIFPGAISVVDGWSDAHTVLVDDLQQLYWVKDEGTVQQTIPEKDAYGDAFGFSSANTVRISPINPDLLLISAEWLKPPQGAITDPHMGGGFGFFLYEIHSKRRVLLSPLNMLCQNAEWSRDGLQVFFTARDSARRIATYRMFWDGGGLKRYVDGMGLVIGQ